MLRLTQSTVQHQAKMMRLAFCVVGLCLVSMAQGQTLKFGDSDVATKDATLKCTGGARITSIRLRSRFFLGINFILGLRINCDNGDTAFYNSALPAFSSFVTVPCDGGFDAVRVGYRSDATFHNLDGLRFSCKGESTFSGTSQIGTIEEGECNGSKRICKVIPFINPAGDIGNINFKCC